MRDFQIQTFYGLVRIEATTFREALKIAMQRGLLLKCVGCGTTHRELSSLGECPNCVEFRNEMDRYFF